MFNTKLITAIIVGASVSITACGDSDSADPVADPVINEQARVALKFAGTYTTACVSDNPENLPSVFPTIYSIASITLGENSGTTTAYEYTDADCTQPNIPAVTVVEYSLVYPGGTQETPLGKADFIDWTLRSITEDGQPTSEEDLGIYEAAGLFDTEYYIYLLDGDLLYLSETGEEFDGTTAEKRENTLDPVPLMRQ